MFDTDNLSEMSLRPFEIKNNLNEFRFRSSQSGPKIIDSNASAGILIGV